MSHSPAIIFDNVSKTYSTEHAPAVRDISLDIPQGKITVLVGSSGSGKTTLLRMINRMVDPTSGTVTVRGHDVAHADPVALRRSIGYVIQSGGLLPHKTVLANAELVPLLNGKSKKEATHLAQEALQQVSLEEELFNKYPRELSGGQQQRVGVARALAGDPDILLMDEAFGAIDPIVRSELQQQLLDLQNRLHKTIVFVTHDITEAFLLADQVVILEKGGKIAQQGTPTEIIAAPASPFVRSFIGANNPDKALSVQVINGRKVVVDELGRPLGVLS